LVLRSNIVKCVGSNPTQVKPFASEYVRARTKVQNKEHKRGW
jgi:hypothetical protein